MVRELEEIFIENAFFSRMIFLIEKNKNNNFSLRRGNNRKNNIEVHHIIPRFYFLKKGLPVNNKRGNLIALPPIEHSEIHYCIIKCVKPEYYNNALQNYSKASVYMKAYNITDEQVAEDFIKYCVSTRKNNLEEYNKSLKENGIPKHHSSKLKGKINGTGKLIVCEETGEIFKSNRDVCYKMGWETTYCSAVSQNCRGVMKACKGYHFHYLEE